MKQWSNCLFFAIALYIRCARKGKAGYIVMRRSRSGAFIHFMYGYTARSGRVRFVGYSPRQPVPRHCPPLSFDGWVKWGDR